MIEIKARRYFVAWWFAFGEGYDMLAALWRDPPDGKFITQWRMRHYDPTKYRLGAVQR